ncbi:MAG: hypothetical protein ACKV2T_31870 [Kofleriaceae bacterium]
MAELAIHRFRFTLARAGGASWGEDRARLFAVAQRDLPARIAEVLASRYPDDADLELHEPIRLALRVSLAELAAACRSNDALTALAERVVGEWSTSSSPVAETERATSPAESAARETPASQHAATRMLPTGAAGVDAPIDVVIAWSRRGELDAALASLSVAALRMWLAWLEPAHHLAHAPMAALDDARVLRDAITARVATIAGARDASMRAAAGRSPPDATSEAARRDVVPVSESHVDTPRTDRSATSENAPARRTPRAARTFSPAIVDGDALPFLMLRPLAQIGYLDALAAGCHGIDEPDALLWIAYQLASQIAPPSTAAAFAGEQEPPRPISDAIVRDALAPATRVAARAVLDGHTHDRPLVLCRVRDALALVDPDGLLPIAMAPTLDELAAIAAPIAPVLAVPLDTAEPVLLRALDARGWRFITDAPPTRGEHWHRVGRLWSNDRAASAPRDVLSLADDIALALGARADVPAALKVAAGIALGDLAQRLWFDREPTSPQLARARFGDLTARITLEHDRVDVRIARGARQRDLDRAGFLGRHRPPWLAERPLDIGAG